VPALDPGASTIVEFEWEPPNPEDYEGVDADSTHFCLLSHLGDVSTAQQDLVTFVRSSNDIAWKNVTVSCDPDSTSCAEAAELRGTRPWSSRTDIGSSRTLTAPCRRYAARE
jgi:hypothetical protein